MRLFKNPRFWLFAEMLAVVALAVVAGVLQAPRESVDSASYLEASRQGLLGMLHSHRTIGYPLILKAVAVVSPTHQMLPLLHLLAHFAAVFLFNHALRRYGFSAWQAFAASSGLLLMVVNDGAIMGLLTDSLGRTAAIVAVSFLLWVAAAPRRIGPWLGLILSVAAAYQIRPVYLYLIPLTLCLGLALRRLHAAWQEEATAWFRYGGGLLAAAALPYLGFCLLRLFLIGHFGLVSFGGYNMVGIAADMLDPKLAMRLPTRWQPLAQEILAGQEACQLKRPLVGNRISIGQWTQNYNVNVWEIACPAAVRLYGNDPVTINRELTSFSQEVIRAKTNVYFCFVAYNLREALGMLLQTGWAPQACLLVAISLFLLRALLFPFSAPASALPQGLPAEVLVLLGSTFAAANLLLVALVEVVIDRYAQAASQFLPPLFSFLAYRETTRILFAWQRRKSV